MPKKSWGQKNSITILYIMLIRYGIVGRQNTIYILLYSSSLSYLILYYTHETRTRIYYYDITLFFFAFFFLLLFYLLLLHTLFLYTHIPNQIQTKTNYLWLLLLSPYICTIKLFLSILILHMLVFSLCLSLCPKIQNLSMIFRLLLS